MPYYETLRQDIERAKEILAKGQVQPEVRDLPAPVRDVLAAHDVKHGTIYGADVFAAYMLLASFVEVIETMDVKVCELALRATKGEVSDWGGVQVRKVEPYLGRPHIPGCTCIIVNGEYRSTEVAGCPIHPRDATAVCVCRTAGCGHSADDHDLDGGCRRCQRLACWS